MRRHIATFVAGSFLLFAGVQVRATDYQKLADQEPWLWHGQAASLLYSVTQHFSDYQVEIVCPKWTVKKRWPQQHVQRGAKTDGDEAAWELLP